MKQTNCRRPQPFGWYCIRTHADYTPCALKPRWWNIKENLRI